MSPQSKNASACHLAICLLLVPTAIVYAGAADGALPSNGHSICFEAEHANEVRPVFHVVRKDGASGGIAITVPEGAACRQPSRDPGHALYHLHIPEDGVYYTWFRVWWQGTCSNSLFAGIHPSVPRFTLMGNVFKKWHWIHGPMAKLKAGDARLSFRYREDGLWIDQVLLTTQANVKPRGRLKATVVPAPPPEQAEMDVSLSADAVACDVLSAPRLRVATHMDRTAFVPPHQSVVLIPGRRTQLTVWLRNNALQDGTGSVSLLTKSRLKAKPDRTQSYVVRRDLPLASVDVALSAPEDIERRSHEAILRAVLPSGKIKSIRLNVSCPFQWICSEAFRLPMNGGIETPNPIEEARNPLEVGAWRLASDECITPMGLLNMRKAVAKRDFVMAYAYTEVRPPHTGRYLLYTANDDMMKVWVNGKLVHRNDSEQPTSATQALTPIDLVQGRNAILVKICQKRNFWEFLLEIRDSDGSLSAVEGCRMSPPPQKQDAR